MLDDRLYTCTNIAGGLIAEREQQAAAAAEETERLHACIAGLQEESARAARAWEQEREEARVECVAERQSWHDDKTQGVCASVRVRVCVCIESV